MKQLVLTKGEPCSGTARSLRCPTRNDDTNAIPGWMPNVTGWQVFHRYHSKISWGDVKLILQILANKDRSRAGECDLIGGATAAPVPFNHNCGPDRKLVVLRQSGIQ